LRATEKGGRGVPRYLVKRTFPGGPAFLADDAGADVLRRICAVNADPEAIRSITPVSVLVPHFYR